MIALCQETNTVHRKGQVCVVFWLEEFEGNELHCMKMWTKVVKERPPEEFFDASAAECVSAVPPQPIAPVGGAGQNQDSSPCNSAGLPVDFGVTGGTSNRAEVIALIQAMDTDVDNDNEPVPENIPEEA